MVNGRYQFSTRENIGDPTAGALAKYGDPQNPISLRETDQTVRYAIVEKWEKLVRDTEANTVA